MKLFCVNTIVFFGFSLCSSRTHYLQADGGCLPHLKVLVSTPSMHMHTQNIHTHNTQTHHYPWHTQPTACPCPPVTSPLAPPHSVPLACHFTSTSLPPQFACVCVSVRVSVCVDIHVCMWLDMCVLDHECTHVSSHLKYGCVCLACISWLISLAENLGRCWWKKHHHK